MKKLSIIILSLILLVACSKDANQVSVQQETHVTKPIQASKISRVFKGNLFTSIDPDPSNLPLVCSGDIPNFGIPTRLLLHGNAIHLGELIWQQSTLVHVSCNVSVPDMELTTSVTGQLMAANGDRIFYTGNDAIDVTNLILQQQPLTGTIEGTWTITGGTGRFEGASGSFTINGSVDFATLSVSFEANGTITY